MELETGVAPLLVSETTWKQAWPERQLSPCNVRLKSYAGESIAVLGTFLAQVSYRHQSAELPLLVVQGNGRSLVGRDWLQVLKVKWQEVHLLQGDSLSDVLERHAEVFGEDLGTLVGVEAKIVVDPQATPVFCKARSVPYAYREKVESELERLIREGILEPIQYANWASPIVTVMKSDGKSIRICRDFKQTVNPVAKMDCYPIPKVEDLFATLAGGKQFTKLDLSQAYQQVPLDEASKEYVTINTQKGLFRYTRLPFGISVAPGIFKRVMEGLMLGIPRVIVYLDDILISGSTQKEHLQPLEEVLSRLQKAGLCAKNSKCQFMANSVTYLGFRIDAEGLYPLPEKVDAIKIVPRPTSVQELKSHLGLLTYYGKFMPNMSIVLAPLYQLLLKSAVWRWKQREEKEFKAADVRKGVGAFQPGTSSWSWLAMHLPTVSGLSSHMCTLMAPSVGGEELQPTGERVVNVCVWSEAVSVVFVWTPV